MHSGPRRSMQYSMRLRRGRRLLTKMPTSPWHVNFRWPRCQVEHLSGSSPGAGAVAHPTISPGGSSGNGRGIEDARIRFEGAVVGGIPGQARSRMKDLVTVMGELTSHILDASPSSAAGQAGPGS